MACGICLEIFHRPHRLSPCLHLFCDPCLRRLARARIQKCPICRSVITDCHLDEGNTNISFKVKRIKSSMYLFWLGFFFFRASGLYWKPVRGCVHPKATRWDGLGHIQWATTSIQWATTSRSSNSGRNFQYQARIVSFATINGVPDDSNSIWSHFCLYNANGAPTGSYPIWSHPCAQPKAWPNPWSNWGIPVSLVESGWCECVYNQTVQWLRSLAVPGEDRTQEPQI